MSASLVDLSCVRNCGECPDSAQITKSNLNAGRDEDDVEKGGELTFAAWGTNDRSAQEAHLANSRSPIPNYGATGREPTFACLPIAAVPLPYKRPSYLPAASFQASGSAELPFIEGAEVAHTIAPKSCP